jgi:hypothetical protein
LVSGVNVREATHVRVDGRLEKIASKWGIDEHGRFLKGGFGVVTEGGKRVTMYEADSYERIDMTEATEALELTDRIKPLLAGHPPEVQGAVLANLASLWLAGHPSALRSDLLKFHTDAIQRLTPVSVREIFGDAGHPSDR